MAVGDHKCQICGNYNCLGHQPLGPIVPYHPAAYPCQPVTYPWPSPGGTGWVCPKCDRVKAPHVDTCQCSEPKDASQDVA